MREESVSGGVPSFPKFRPTTVDVFARRARRLRSLGPGHAMEGYLGFAEALAQAQDAELSVFPDVSVPDAAMLEHFAEHGLPPISVDGHSREPAWRGSLARLLQGFDGEALPAAADHVIADLRRADEATLERDASNLLAGAFGVLEAGRSPFIGAALQVYWVKMSLMLGHAAIGPSVRYGLCPACGSQPVASVVRAGGETQGLRYLICSLCAGEWHVVRIKCSACGSTRGISYLMVEGATDGIKAECCDECKTYLKILYWEKDTEMEPYADDLGTLALDMLVDEHGYCRRGPNLLFSPGR